MPKKTDIFVPSTATGIDDFRAQLDEPTLWVHRFSDDNDGAQYKWGTFWRKCRTAEEAAALVERGKRGNYMGMKRRRWYPSTPEFKA